MGLGRYMDGCGNCMKYSLFFINLLIFIGSIVLLGFGIYISVNKSFGAEIMGTNMYSGATYVIIGASILVALISCFGCFGAAQEVRCMLLTYFIIVFLIFITLLVGGVLLYVFRNKVEITLRNELDIASLQKYDTNPDEKQTWDELQTTLDCCGVNNFTDWKWRNTIPASCCKPLVPGKNNTFCSKEMVISTPGCFKSLLDLVKKNAAILGGIGIAVACVMLLGMVFSCALFNLID